VSSRHRPADGAIDEGTGEGAWVGDIEEVHDVQGRGGQAVEDADRPALLREALVPGADVAPRVGVHFTCHSIPPLNGLAAPGTRRHVFEFNDNRSRSVQCSRLS